MDILTILEFVGTAVVFFVAGAAVGAHNVPSVEKAISALKSAEANAKAQLDKITSHKVT